MASNPKQTTTLTPDILILVFQQLAGDYTSLCNVGLTSRAWRCLSLPCLLQIVDLSSHNNKKRLPEHESPRVLPVVYAEFGAAYRPRNLVPRQRAFLRLIAARPDLGKHVKYLAWTFIWMDFEDSNLTEIDRQTWDVFSRMYNVAQLDLASLHEVWHEDYVRQNPARLFPAVTDLRLLGWMHRALVKAIVTSLDATKLRSLKLDYLQDEGSLPNGAPLNMEAAVDYAHHARRTDSSDLVDDELFERQETGKACIFPGPMWLPLRLLRAHSLESLTHLQVKVTPFDMEIDLRSYHTLFHETAETIITGRESLRSLVVVFGESPDLYEETAYISACGTGRSQLRYTYRPWCIKMAATFLDEQLAVLNQNPFPHLESIVFEGFHILETADPGEAAAAHLADTFQSIRDCSFPDATFTSTSSVDHRLVFQGFDSSMTDFELEGYKGVLESS